MNLVVETKNSKNIFAVWVNETSDYCNAIKKENMDFIGIAIKVFLKMDPQIIRSCPIVVVSANY